MDYTPFVEVIEPAKDLKYGQNCIKVSYWVKRHVLEWFRLVSGLLTLSFHPDKSNSLTHRARYPAQNMLATAHIPPPHLADQTVETAALCILHQDANLRVPLGEEGSVVLDDIRRAARVEEFQLSEELLVHRRVGRSRDHLQWG